jgi:uncharacterized protein with NRDE domain
MCVVAVAIDAHPRWRLIVAGNRDEYHARASAPLARWDDGSGIIAGRDLVSGGSWMGVSDAGRFAVVTNIREADGPDPAKLSRGALVADWLAAGRLPEYPVHFNPFNLIVTDRLKAAYLSNRPEPLRHSLGAGVHGLSNAIPDEHWPRKDRLVHHLAAWLDKADDADHLFEVLSEESVPDREAYPVFIRSPIYGTRCSTVITVDHDGQGQIFERRFGPDGERSGDTSLNFLWPSQRV